MPGFVCRFSVFLGVCLGARGLKSVRGLGSTHVKVQGVGKFRVPQNRRWGGLLWGAEDWDSVMVTGSSIWEFPKIRGTLFWGPYKKDPTI